MLIKLEGIWVNPAHVVQVYESAHSGFSTIELANPDERMQVRGAPDEVAEKLIAGDVNYHLAVARDALESILEEVTLEGSKEPVDLDFLRAMALRGLGRAEP